MNLLISNFDHFCCHEIQYHFVDILYMKIRQSSVICLLGNDEKYSKKEVKC